MNLNSKEINEIDNQRTENIIKIGLSKNVEGFRRGCHYLSKDGLEINQEEMREQEILQEGMAEIKELVEDKKEYFLCIDGVEEMGLEGYFKYITRGKQIYEKEQIRETNQDDHIRVLKERKNKMAERGDFKGEQECKIEIMELEQPEAVLAILQEREKKGGKIDRKELEREIKRYEGIIAKKEEYSEEKDAYLGVHYNIRELLSGYFYKDSMSENPLRYMSNYYGSLCIDYEHIHLFEKMYKESDKFGKRIIRATKIYLALETYYSEITDLKERTKKQTGNKIDIHLETNPDNFRVRKLPQYSRGYMSKLTKPKGARCYEIKPTNLNTRCLIMSMGIGTLKYKELPKKYREASKTLQGLETSLLYKGLSVEEEEIIIPQILNESFRYRDGYFSEEIEKEFMIRHTKYGSKNTKQGRLSNIYTRLVQPYAIDILGSVVLQLLKYIEAYKGKVWVYYINAEKICIAVDESLEESYDKEILKATWNITQRVGKITYKGIVDGLE